MAIKTFKDKATAAAFAGLAVKSLPPAIRTRAQAKLDQLNAALVLDDMRAPPSNRLESLKGDRRGQYSVRINGQWRLCFVWSGGNAYDVQIVDYHD